MRPTMPAQELKEAAGKLLRAAPDQLLVIGAELCGLDLVKMHFLSHPQAVYGGPGWPARSSQAVPQ